MHKQKIGLYLGTEPNGGGTFQYNQAVLEAIAWLPREHYETVVAYSSKTMLPYLDPLSVKIVYNPRPLISRLISFACRKLRIPLPIWRSIHSVIDPFARRLINESCDLWIFPSQDIFAYTIDVPSLGTIHDLMHRYEKQFEELSANGEYEAREFHYRKMVGNARGVLVDSNVGKQQVLESYGIDESKIHVLPYIAPSYIYSNQMPKDFDQKYTLPSKFIFYPAQFWTHKNHIGLIRAASIIKVDNPDFKLVFVGAMKNGYALALDLVDELELSSSIQFLGYVPDEDMPELYRRARAIVMPTFCGPTNIPPLEAFVTGCPLAVSRVYAMPEQVGDAALLFDPRSSTDIARVLVELWNDNQLCEELSKKGKARADLFNPKVFNTDLLKIIQNIQ
tara:strand:+ start:646 stop:1821 length:1176 start_codon:yes stop_codon:yes gene_type:complete